MRLWVRSLVLLSGLRIRLCRELWCKSKSGSDLVLLWLWCSPVATALIGPLAWEPPYAVGTALKRTKGKRKKKKMGADTQGISLLGSVVNEHD